MRFVTVFAPVVALLLSFSSLASAQTCDAQFLTKFTANYMRLGCIKDIEGACAKFEQIDNRPVIKKRDLKELEMSMDLLGLSPNEVSGVVRMLASFAVRRNPYYMAARMVLAPSTAGGPCDGPAYYFEDEKEVKVDFYDGDKYVKMKEKPNHCQADFDIWDNSKVVNFFAATHRDQLAAIKDKSTCHYMTKINKLVAEENAKDSKLGPEKSATRSRSKFRQGRN